MPRIVIFPYQFGFVKEDAATPLLRIFWQPSAPCDFFNKTGKCENSANATVWKLFTMFNTVQSTRFYNLNKFLHQNTSFFTFYKVRKLGGKTCILRGAIYDIKVVPLLRNT